MEWLDQEPEGADNGMVRLISGRDRIPYGACPDDLLTEALQHIDEWFDAVFLRGRLLALGYAPAAPDGPVDRPDAP